VDIPHPIERGLLGQLGPRSEAAVEEGSQKLCEGQAAWQEFALLYETHVRSVFRYFWFHTHSRPVAEDLVSETFLRALQSFSTYSACHGSFNAWLYGIARHVLSRHYIQVGRERATATEMAPPAEQPALGLEEGLDLWRAVSELATVEREVIALKFGGGLKYREIGEIMRLREPQVAGVLSRALQKLRARLHGEEGADGR